MRRLWTFIKFLVFLFIILIATGAGLFWLSTGESVVLPLARWIGNYFLDPFKLEIKNINGSVYNGYSISDLKIISDDEVLINLDYASISPDWDLVLSGLDGIPFIKDLKIKGINSDVEKIMLLVNHFSTDSSKEEKEEEQESSFKLSDLKINPVNISIEDINIKTPQVDLSLLSLILSDDGKIFLDTKIISNENIFPIRANAFINFDSIEIISSDLKLGEKSSGSFKGKVMPPFDIRADLTALSIEELLKFYNEKIDVSGRLDGRVFFKSDSEIKNLEASGIISMPRGEVMSIPLNFRLPWNFEKNIFSLDDASLNTKAASVKLTALVDIENSKVKAVGEANNISLKEIGKIAAPDAKLDGEGGTLNFNVSTAYKGDILSNTDGELNAEMPFISAAGMRILKDLSAHAKLKPGEAPKIALGGEIFNGKLFARGEANQDKNRNLKPQAIISVVNLDIATLAKTFPEISKSVSKPSGKITATAKISDNLSVETKVTSDKISANGITLQNIIANLFYDHQNSKAEIEDISAKIGKGIINASGNVNLKNQDFNFNASLNNFEPKVIPELKQVSGIYNLDANAYGKFSDLKTINASLNLNGKNVGYSGMNLGNLDIPVNYSKNQINIPNARASLPGGNLNLNGNVNLNNVSNPGLDISASTSGIDISKVFDVINKTGKSKTKSSNPKISGKVHGNLKIKGPLKTASVTTNLYANGIKYENLIDVPNAALEAQGDMRRINLKKLDAKINNANIKGNGNLAINQKNFMNSAVNFAMNVKNLDLKPILLSTAGTAPVSGIINGNLNLKGTISQPNLNINLNSPIYASKMFIEDIALSLKAPEQNHYVMNAGARIEDFKINLDGDLKKQKDFWMYKIKTKPLNIDDAIKIQMPAMSGIAKGFAQVSVNGNTKNNSPIDIKVTSKIINIIDKLKIQDISLPLSYLPSKNKIEMKDGIALVSDGTVNTGVDVDLNKSTWKSNVKVRNLDFGKLVQPFLPEGELIGSADVDVNAKGGFGVMATSFANGKFNSSPGYFHKMDILDKVTPTKKVSFEKISGTFFWNGSDLFLNPGTQATAGPDEPLYRYFSINGSAGIPGKGLKLICDGRFDLKILDQLLGAMKGIFQYMTGTLARNVLKDAAGRVLGLKKRDFQNVSFTLANSWQELRLLDLKITKPIEDFLPIDILNRDDETQRDDKQFKLRLRIPTGPGDKSIEEESTSDQFKEQLIDNLFNIGF